jgi:hypothetical protein
VYANQCILVPSMRIAFCSTEVMRILLLSFPDRFNYNICGNA